MVIPPRARVYVGSVAVAGLATVAWAALNVERVEWVLPLALAMLASTHLASVNLRNFDLSLGVVLVIAALLLTGVEGAVLVAAVDALGGKLSDHAFVKRAFNFGQFALAALAGGGVYLALQGPVAAFETQHFPALLGQVLVVASVYALVTAVLLSAVIAMTERISWFTVLGSMWSTAPAYVAYGLLGLLMAVIWVETAPFVCALLLLPLVTARWALQQHAEQQEAYEATLRALVATIEVKDGYTGGHSERVSQVATMIARESHLSEERVESVRYAGLLHDVGKIGIPTGILNKQGKLNDEEYDLIKQHPDRGVEMLNGIGFLGESLTGVYHHHERMDGRGYPLGLVGDEIPEIARIVMVSDAFDSMTSTRSYRAARTVDEAIAELRRCEGTQFDPRMVDALVRAVDKHGWESTPEPFHGPTVHRDGTPIVPAPAQDAAADDTSGSGLRHVAAVE